MGSRKPSLLLMHPSTPRAAAAAFIEARKPPRVRPLPGPALPSRAAAHLVLLALPRVLEPQVVRVAQQPKAAALLVLGAPHLRGAGTGPPPGRTSYVGAALRVATAGVPH
jgi:hypothetical protein